MPAEEKKVEETKNITDAIAASLIKKSSTLAVAESVTAGNIQAVLSLATNATRFFQGGITVYNLGQKCRHLNVEPIHALDCNCVSEKIAEQMALQVGCLFCADYGMGITGYASPVPEENIDELFAYISICKNDKLLLTKKIIAPQMPPREVQLFYTHECIRLLDSIVADK